MSETQQNMDISLDQLVIKQITIDLHVPVALIKAMVYLVCILLVIIITYYILIIIKTALARKGILQPQVLKNSSETNALVIIRAKLANITPIGAPA